MKVGAINLNRFINFIYIFLEVYNFFRVFMIKKLTILRKKSADSVILTKSINQKAQSLCFSTSDMKISQIIMH